MVTAQDIAETTMFLMSDAAKNVSGQSIAVDANVETI
jgi:enoyl-[acyl-carrier-protein] reductase (NADH)